MPLSLCKRVEMIERHLRVLGEQADKPAFETAPALLAFGKRYGCSVAFHLSGRGIVSVIGAGRLKIAKGVEHILFAHFETSGKLDCVVFCE